MGTHKPITANLKSHNLNSEILLGVLMAECRISHFTFTIFPFFHSNEKKHFMKFEAQKGMHVLEILNFEAREGCDLEVSQEC